MHYHLALAQPFIYLLSHLLFLSPPSEMEVRCSVNAMQEGNASEAASSAHSLARSGSSLVKGVMRLPTSSYSIFFPVINDSCKAQPILTAFTAPSNLIGGSVSSKQLAVNSFASVMNASLNRP